MSPMPLLWKLSLSRVVLSGSYCADTIETNIIGEFTTEQLIYN